MGRGSPGCMWLMGEQLKVKLKVYFDPLGLEKRTKRSVSDHLLKIKRIDAFLVILLVGIFRIDSTTRLQPVFFFIENPLSPTSLYSLGWCLTDWEHGTPPKIIVSDFIFFSKLGKIGLKKVLGGVGFPHGTFFSPGASFSQWTFH